MSLQTWHIVLCVAGALLFSRQILKVSMSLFLSVSSLVVALLSLVLCSILVIVILFPTVIVTCMFASDVAGGKPTNSDLLNSVCRIGEKNKHEMYQTQKY